MHPTAMKFGLDAGVLKKQGDEVLLSDTLLEAISQEAQHRVRLQKPPIDGNFLVDMTVRAAEKALNLSYESAPGEIAPFFAALNRIMYYTLCRVAERARLAYSEPDRLMTNLDFWGELVDRAQDIPVKPGQSVAKFQKALFKLCLEIVRERYAANDPDNLRHADLAALFMFNFWNVTGLLQKAQGVLIKVNEISSRGDFPT